MAAPSLLRALPLLRHRHRLRFHHHRHIVAGILTPLRRLACSSATETTASFSNEADQFSRAKYLYGAENRNRCESIDKEKEKEIWQEAERLAHVAKNILHSGRYMDGERLNAEDEKIVVAKLLAYHPNSEDKIGCGLDSIVALPSELEDART
ncbi:DCL homolog, chloroplastic-like protein [Drosera capensis]